MTRRRNDENENPIRTLALGHTQAVFILMRPYHRDDVFFFFSQATRMMVNIHLHAPREYYTEF